MKTLLLMRHAKSSWAEAGQTDFERPLKPRGERASTLMGRLLQVNRLTPAHVLCSAAVRARQTGQLIVREFSPQPTLDILEELYHASPRTLVKYLRATDDRYESLLLIAHNPGLEELIDHWSSEFVAFPTAAVALYRFAVDRWSQIDLDVSIAYDRLWKPKELDLDHLEETLDQE